MGRSSVLNDALRTMFNAGRRCKRQVVLKTTSLQDFLAVMQKHGFVGEIKREGEGQIGRLHVELHGRMNKVGACTPRYEVGVSKIRHWTDRLLPMKHEMYENPDVVRFCRLLHNSSECLAERSETVVKPDDKTGGIPESSPGPPPEARSIRGSPVSWFSLGLLLVTGAGLVYYYDQEKKRLIKDFKEESKPGPGVGKAAIGGPFKLVNHEGNEVTEQDYKGYWTLVYFGFTHCPDICPDELQKMAEAVDVIEKKDGIRITPIFISVDPERDNVEQVREYVKEFHPRLVGLTGASDNIRQVAREFRVYYMKTEEEGSDYLVDHSIIMYLMDPQMDFVKFFGKNYDVMGLADGIVEEIKRYKQ